MRAPSDLSRPAPLAIVGMAAAVALAWVAGLDVRRYQLGIGDGPYRGDYLIVIGVCLGIATVLAVGLVALSLLRAPWWLLVATGAAAGHHTVLGVSAYRLSRTTGPDPSFEYGAIHDGVVDALMPGSWPLLLVVVAAVAALVRPGRTRPAARPGRLAVISISAAFVLAAMTGPVAWYFDVYFFQMDGPGPEDFQSAIVTAAATAAVLLVGALVVRVRWGTWFQLVPAGFGVLVQAFVVVSCLDGAQGAPDPGYITPDHVEIRFALEAAALLPTTWPLLLVLAWAVVASTPVLRRGDAGAGMVNPCSHRPGRLGADAS